MYQLITENNRTYSLLDSNESYIGVADNVINFSKINITIISDKNSAINGLELQFSEDLETWVTHQSYTYTGGNETKYNYNVNGTFFRIKYTNGNTAQTLFTITTIYYYNNYSINSILHSIDTFGNIVATTKTPIVNLIPTHGVSNIRDIVTITGFGSVTNTPGSNNTGEYALSTTTNGLDSAILSSAERGRYIAGYMGECGIAIRIPSNPIGNQNIKWGIFDDYNGCYFGVDSSGIYVAVLKGQIETKIYQSNWNNDTMDGTGTSKQTLDLSNGYIFQIGFTWYGYGNIDYYIISDDRNTFDGYYKLLLHKYKSVGGTTFNNPNLPIRCVVENNGTESSLIAYVAGRQYSIIGNYIPDRRITCERILSKSVSSTFIPIISFRRKTNYMCVSIKSGGIEIISDVDLIVEIRINSTLTNAIWRTPTNTRTTETALESDTSASAIDVTTGELIYVTLVSQSGGNKNTTRFTNEDEFKLDIPNDQPISICAKSISGSNASVNCIFRLVEDW